MSGWQILRNPTKHSAKPWLLVSPTGRESTHRTRELAEAVRDDSRTRRSHSIAEPHDDHFVCLCGEEVATVGVSARRAFWAHVRRAEEVS